MNLNVARSVRGKLLLLTASVTFIALVASGASLVWYEARAYRERWTSDLVTQAEILGRSSAAAIAFDDRKTARENLELLTLRPAILAAALYDEQGRLFEGYSGREALPEAVEAGDRVRIHRDRIVVVLPIGEGDKQRGAVYLSAVYGLQDRIRHYAAILAVVMLLSLAAAVIIGAWLQRRITEPIAKVAETANRVVHTRDFSHRVEKTTTDEIGYLVDAFNTMLAEIGARSQALVAADRMKDQFLATLSHELRNPLAPLSNAMYVLRTARGDPELTARMHEMIERQVQHMVRLVDDLLDVSRISTGKLMLKRTALDLRSSLHAAVELARPAIEARRHTLKVAPGDEPLPALGDDARLAQVFSNLLNNAARYTPEGGVIELAARRAGRNVRVDVADNGIGLEPGQLERIFDMFSQGQTGLERTAQAGLGVGLALAKQLVEMHGGSIAAQSDGRGRGSRFVVMLPADEAPALVLPDSHADVRTEAPAVGA